MTNSVREKTAFFDKVFQIFIVGEILGKISTLVSDYFYHVVAKSEQGNLTRGKKNVSSRKFFDEL